MADEYPDALPGGPLRGRGAGLNPGNRFETVRLHVLGETLDGPRVGDFGDDETPRTCPTQILADRTRRIINYVDPRTSPDIGFRWTINPYRGCEHGCIYCYARPTHETLGMSCGLDFETKIMAKHDGPRLLRAELAADSWAGEPIVMSGVTDPYQPIERELHITRGCLEVMAECRQPVSLVTKNRMITRDIDLLQQLARHNATRVAISVTTLDNRLAAAMEPRASAPGERLRAIRELTDAGIPVVAMTAPIIPGLNDREVPALLQAAREHGAVAASWVLLRLPFQIKALFLDWLARQYPERAARIERMIRDTRDGELYDSTPGVRHRGRGLIAQQIKQTFDVFAARNGLDRKLNPLSSASFRRPEIGGQMALFG